MGKKVLLVHHEEGGSCHTPAKSSKIMKKILKQEGYDIDERTSLDVYTDEECMATFDLIVQAWTGGELTPEQERGLIDAVMNGAGLAGWHGGLNDCFRASLNYKFLLGSQFVAHPGGNVEFTVNITKPDDPIVKGIKDFTLTSEQYYLHVDPGILSGVSGEILATSTFHHVPILNMYHGTVMPAVYKRSWADGKIFYVAYGHSYKDFDVPGTREILRQGFLWATRDEE
ncbi:MAG: ThuA domain-containing protein [Candidatus Hodarchaeota archaeon]